MRALTVSVTHCVNVVMTDNFTDVLVNMLRVPPDIWGIGEMATVCMVCACVCVCVCVCALHVVVWVVCVCVGGWVC